jgi:CRISPR/Cas system CMR-associated protein Cmr5 small subunit
MNEKTHRTREQIRAAKAHDLILKVKAESKDAKEIGRQCLRLPALIHQCGLCQAVAFLESKKFQSVVGHLAEVVQAPDHDSKKTVDGQTFAKLIRETGMVQYQWLTREALKSAQWLKRYSEAILNLKPGDTSDAAEQGNGGVRP